MKKLLVHLHLYYHEQLDYMLEKLGSITDCDWDLYVTTCSLQDDVVNKILNFKKDAQIIELENAGYDLYPFTHILSLVDLNNYEFIIKIHTKKTHTSKKINDLRYETIWRDVLISSLLENKEKFENNLKIFSSDPEVGMIGYRGVITDINKEAVENSPITNSLLDRLAITERNGKYIAGTMFMVRAKLMQPIKNLKLKLKEFKDGNANKTGDAGTLVHSLETIIGMIISHQNFSIFGVSSIYDIEDDIETSNNFKQVCIEGLQSLCVGYWELGKLNQEKNDLEKALIYYEEAIKVFNTLCDNSKIQDNIKEKIFKTKENIVNILNHLGDNELKNNNCEEALNYYAKMLGYGVSHDLLYSKISRCMHVMGAYVSAVNFLEEALKLNPKNYYIYKLMGDIYQQNIEDFDKAIQCFTQYIELAPKSMDIADVYNKLAYLYDNVNRYENTDKQIEYLEKSIELVPTHISSLRNLTVAYQRVGREQDAVKCFQKILRIGATMDDYFNYAALLIKLGNFEEGWKYYEYRFSKENRTSNYPTFNQPKWKGQKIPDKTLLVHGEQGFGDSIQFFRYLECVKPLAKKIIFKVQDELVSLIKPNAENVEVVGMSEVKLEHLSFDYHVPLMSLVHLLHARVDNIPLAQGYIKADESKAAKYKEKFFNNDCLKIGISWHGSKAGYLQRDIPLETFVPLTKLKNVKVYSFQKDAIQDLRQLPFDIDIVDLGKTFNDFSDTAAAMANVDLFVTSDNGVFQLAGAMGKKTFLLLNKVSEWRWFLNEGATPWYDSVKILKKQDENESWDLVMQRVIEILSDKQEINVTPKGKNGSVDE